MKAKFLVLAIVLGLVSVPALGDSIPIGEGTLNPGEALTFQFTVDPSNPPSSRVANGLQFAFFFDSPSVPFADLSFTASLFDGTSLLGTQSRGFSLPVPLDGQILFFTWKSADSPFIEGNPPVIDISTILNGTLDGRMDLMVSGGSVDWRFLQLFAVSCAGPSGCITTGSSNITSISTTPVPEPSTLSLLAAGLLVGGIFRRRFKG